MFKLIACLFLALFAVASAGYLSYGHSIDTAYVGHGAYGAHGPFAVSYRARVDAPREDVVSYATVPYAYHAYDTLDAYHHY